MKNELENKVEIYIERPDRFIKPDKFLEILSPEEIQRLNKFKFEKPKKNFLISRTLMRHVISEKLDCKPEDLKFNIDAHGKPHVTGLCFNLSHTEGLVVLAVTEMRDIGIDTENIDREISDTDIAKRYFAEEEYKTMLSLKGAERKKHFIKIWTLKEAYTKAVGLGLKIPLSSFSFEIENNDIVKFKSSDERLWQFKMFSINNHIVSLAIEGGDTFSTEIIEDLLK